MRNDIYHIYYLMLLCGGEAEKVKRGFCIFYKLPYFVDWSYKTYEPYCDRLFLVDWKFGIVKRG